MFRLFQRFNGAERHTTIMSLKHDLLTNLLLEPEHTYQRLYHMLHGVMIIIMEQDFIERHMQCLPVRNCAGAWFC